MNKYHFKIICGQVMSSVFFFSEDSDELAIQTAKGLANQLGYGYILLYTQDNKLLGEYYSIWKYKSVCKCCQSPIRGEDYELGNGFCIECHQASLEE